MAEELKAKQEAIQETWKPSKDKVEVVGKVLGCELRVVTTADGKRHFESDCLDTKARNDMAGAFEEEAILRIKPKVVLEETSTTSKAELSGQS